MIAETTNLLKFCRINKNGVTLDTYTHLTEDKQKEQENVAKTVKIS